MQTPKFETTDFYLAAFLRCMGYDLVDVRRDGARATFVFQDQRERRDTVMSYYNDRTSVRPLAFVGIIKDLKSMIHNA